MTETSKRDDECPYAHLNHTIGVGDCTCDDTEWMESVEKLDDDIELVALDFKYNSNRSCWEATNEVDGRVFQIRKAYNDSGTWWVKNHPIISISTDFPNLNAAKTALCVAEEERIEEIIGAPVQVMETSGLLDDEEGGDIVYPGWGEHGSYGGGLDDEFDAANSQSLKDLDDKWKSKSGGTGSGTGSKSYSSGTKYTYLPSCRHDPTEAVEIDGIKYHGGSEMKVKNWIFPSNWLVVCLLGDHKTDILSGTDEALVTALYPLTHQGNVLNIKWPDMGAPPVNKGFFAKIHEYALANDITHVLYYCMGGHGRTGTALAATMVEVCDDDPVEAVRLIRKDYCVQAVESSSQTKYLLRLKYTNDEIAEMEALVASKEKKDKEKGGKDEKKLNGSKS